jgi:hypothetical protein
VIRVPARLRWTGRYVVIGSLFLIAIATGFALGVLAILVIGP